jgi:NADPH-dependent 2,4-dienoyl-CoA reductase/sulfur reductase-like enzyme
MTLASVVVVGAGLAGVTACASLRELGFAGRLVLLSGEGREPYDRPPLSKEVLLGEPQELRLRDSAFYAENEIDLRLAAPVVEVCPAQGEVVLDGGDRVRAEAVVLATGGRPRRLPVPGGDQGLVLRTLDDALRLRHSLEPGARILIAGGGLIGAEVASAAVSAGCEVYLADPDPLPLSAAVGPLVATWLQNLQRQAGVHVMAAGIVHIEADGRRARLADGAVLEVDTVLTGVGIVPGEDLARSAGLDTDGGILVDQEFRTSNSAVFAIGDAARVRGKPRVEHWDAALHAGQAVASAILAQPLPDPGPPWWWTDRHGHHVEVTGVVPVERMPVVVGDPDAGAFVAAWAGEGGRLEAAVAVDQTRRNRVVRRLVRTGAPLDELLA